MFNFKITDVFLLTIGMGFIVASPEKQEIRIVVSRGGVNNPLSLESGMIRKPNEIDVGNVPAKIEFLRSPKRRHVSLNDFWLLLEKLINGDDSSDPREEVPKPENKRFTEVYECKCGTRKQPNIENGINNDKGINFQPIIPLRGFF